MVRSISGMESMSETSYTSQEKHVSGQVSGITLNKEANTCILTTGSNAKVKILNYLTCLMK